MCNLVLFSLEPIGELHVVVLSSKAGPRCPKQNDNIKKKERKEVNAEPEKRPPKTPPLWGLKDKPGLLYCSRLPTSTSNPRVPLIKGHAQNRASRSALVFEDAIIYLQSKAQHD